MYIVQNVSEGYLFILAELGWVQLVCYKGIWPLRY